MRTNAERSVRASGSDLIPDGFCACPIDTAFDVIGKKWTVLIIRNMLRGHTRFNQLLEHIEGINPKSLSARLKELEREQLISKRIIGTTPVRIEYRLTDKGYDTINVLIDMARWAIRWAPDRVFGSSRRPKDLGASVVAWEQSLLGVDGDKRRLQPLKPSISARRGRLAPA